MKKGWKVLACGLALAGVMGLAGCGDDSAKSSAPAGQTEGALMQKVKKEGKLIVGTSSGFPPYEFLDTSVEGAKSVDGIDIRLAQAVADKLGVKLEVQDMTFQSLLSSMAANKIDIAISAINPTDERKKTVDFSENYLEGKQTLLIRKEDEGKYKSLDDFAGKKIAVQQSTIQEKLAREQIKDANVVALARVPDALMELMHGKVDAVPIQNIVGGQYLLVNENLAPSNVSCGNYSGGSAVAVPKGNEDMVKLINEVIEENKKNGQIDQWVKDMTAKAVKNAKE